MVVSKVGNYLGISRKGNYLIIGSDNIKAYAKKMYLIILSKDAGDNAIKIAKNKSKEYNINCIMFDKELSDYVGIENCKIVALKNKGLSDAILRCENEYKICNVKSEAN